MSGVAIIRALLVADATLIAACPAARIYAGVVPQSFTAPAIGITEIVSVEVPHIDGNSDTTIVESRVEVTVIASDYPTQKSVLALARKACNYSHGTIASLPVVSVRRLSNGPDMADPDSQLVMQSMDFEVIYHEAQ